MNEINAIVASLNARKFYVKAYIKDGKTKTTISIQDGMGNAYFINRAIVNVGVDANGQPIAKLDEQGNPVFTWAVGKKLESQNTPVQQTLPV